MIHRTGCVRALTVFAALQCGGGLDAQELYGRGTAGTGGMAPRIWTVGTPWPGNSKFEITLDEAGGLLPAWIGIGVKRTAIPFLGVELNNELLVVAAMGLTKGTFGKGDGTLRLPLPIPNQSVLIGQFINLQWVLSDLKGPAGLAASRGLEVKVGLPPMVFACGSAGKLDPLYYVDPRLRTVVDHGRTVAADNPWDLDLTPDKDMLVLSAVLSREFVIADVAQNGKRLAAVSVKPDMAYSAALTPDGKRCYGLVRRGANPSHLIEMDIDRASTNFGKKIGQVTGLPATVTSLEKAAVSADGKTMVACNLSSAVVCVIDVDKSSKTFNKVSRTIWLSGILTDVAINADGTLAFAVSASLTTSSTLLVLDTVKGVLVRRIRNIGTFAVEIVRGPHDEFVWVATPNSNAIVKIGVDPRRTATYGSVLKSTAKMKSPFTVGLSPDATRVYATENGGDMLHELDAKTLGLIQSIKIGFAGHRGLEVR